MACLQTTGFTLDCRKSIGGLDQIWIGQLDTIASYTVVSGAVTAMAMTGSYKFYNYKLRRNSSEAWADNSGDVASGAGYLTHNVQFQLDTFDVSKRNEIRIIAQKPVVVIAKDKNGLLSVYGIVNGLDLSSGKAGTGKEANSLNGFNITLTGEELEYPYGISQAITDTLD